MITINHKTIQREARRHLQSKITRHLFYNFFYLSSLSSLIHHFKGRGIIILVYHRVNRHIKGYPLRNMACVTPDNFKRQMLYLKRHFEIISLSEAIQERRYLMGHPNLVAVTFDDGYEDNYLYAFPILKEYAIPVTIFLTAGLIGTTRRLWWNRLEEAIIKAGRRSIHFIDQGINIQCKLHQEKDARGLLLSLLKNIKQMNNQAKEAFIQRFIEYLSIDNENMNNNHSDGQMLSWDQISEMKDYGITFGAHSLNHLILSSISEKELREEIYQSMATIYQNIRISPDLFAYPNGYPEDFTKEAVDILREAGFVCAVTMVDGRNTCHTDPFYLKRICITGNDSMIDFSGKLSGIDGIFHYLKSGLRA